MCGIVGYIGNKEKKQFVLEGLKELEYRGYDSAGLAVLKDGELSFFKAVGKLENLANKCSSFTSDGFGLCIGHTRWATHGKPTEINAHPHLGQYSCVIHNGIIENYKELKEFLEKEGVSFVSQTDTEVIVQLFEYYAKNLDAFEAFKTLVSKLKGAFATLLISKKDPNKIFFAKNAATPTSLAALSMAPAFPPVFRHSNASLRLGNRWVSGRKNSRRPNVQKSSRFPASGNRCGKVSAYCIGRCMSGVPIWALTAPS